MCVLAFAWDTHPRWKLALIGNRDELHARPASPLARWEDRPGVIAGRDLESGGSWLGVSGHGRLAVVTNRRNPAGPASDKASRGALVADWLAGDGRYERPALDDLDDFNPFSLIVATPEEARFLSNRPKAEQRTLSPGLYGLSNGALDEGWPKTKRIKALLEQWLNTGDAEPQRLLDAVRAEDAPQLPPERAIESPIFILNPIYGTRCSTVVLVDRNGEGRIVERRYDKQGDATGETALAFSWRGAA